MQPFDFISGNEQPQCFFNACFEDMEPDCDIDRYGVRFML